MDTNRDSVFLAPLVDGIDFLPARAGMYCILNRVNGKCYVGQAKNIHQRCVQHRRELSNGLSSNKLLRRDAVVHGADAFFFFALRIDAIAGSEKKSQLNKIEIWFAVVSGCEKARKYGFQHALLASQGFVFREYGVGGVSGSSAGQHVGIRTARRSRRCRCAWIAWW